MNTDTAGLAKWKRWTDLPLMVLAIGSLPILLLELVADRLPRVDRSFVFGVNVAVFVAFGIDYVAELALTRSKRAYVRTQWASLAIVMAQLLALLPALTVFGALRAARALRVAATVARLFGVGGTTRADGRSLLKRHAASFAFGVAGFTWIASAAAFTLAEDVGAGRRVHSFFDALWWSAATITTVGYGDIYPVTALGRIIAVFTMLVGISTLAVVTARIAQFLIKADPTVASG